MTALEALAARCGIVATFRDARGQMQTASEETQRTLLAAMGIAVHDAHSVETALAALQRADSEQVLAPVYVVRRDAAASLAVTVNLPAETGPVSWHVTLEDGGECRGTLRFAELPLVERQRGDGLPRERRSLQLPASIPLGYHLLALEPGAARAALIVAPDKCWLPSRLQDGERVWGVSAQLYLLRSADNWGIGDYRDLRHLVEMLGARGADVVGLNPLHALFLDAPEQASPYSPASRLQLNVLNIDIAGLIANATQDDAKIAAQDDVRTVTESAHFHDLLQRCRDAHLLDYSGVVELKLPLLRLLFAAAQRASASPQWGAFEKFRREGGAVLGRGCLFQALREHFAAEAPPHADWHAWPREYRDPGSPAVARFADEHADLVTFYAWLQFVADAQLGAAAEAAGSMAVGLYRDLAVGADPSGAETWANQRAVVAAAHVGAPPDIYNPAGQDWGLPPFNPRALREEAYRSFIDLLRANMRHAGGLRIDHVMALQQLYWVPQGQSAAAGAYVRYPLDDLVGILALESQRNRCLVVGEDLGTVPEGFRERMADANILSYRILFFEKDEKGFIPPQRYPALALAAAGSHDLPTLRAWWQDSDLELKEALHLFPTDADARDAREARKRDRQDLVWALRHAGLADGEATLDVGALNRAAHAYLARSESLLAIAQLDDICDEAAPVNVPTTSDENPNWRRRMALTLEQLAAHPRLAAVCDIFRRERGAVRLR